VHRDVEHDAAKPRAARSVIHRVWMCGESEGFGLWIDMWMTAALPTHRP
jgi:hypothetical protein